MNIFRVELNIPIKFKINNIEFATQSPIVEVIRLLKQTMFLMSIIIKMY